MASKRRSGGSAGDLTIEILRQIRDELRGLNTGQGETNARLDQTNARLDQANARLDEAIARLDVANVRAELHGQAITKLVQEVGGLNGRFDNFLTGVHHEEHDELRKEQTALRARVERLEKQTGTG